jgi:hypothetical protein
MGFQPMSHRQDADATALLHQKHGPAALDFPGDLPVQMRRHPGDAARKDFTALGHKFFQEIRVFVIKGFNGDVDSTPRHGAVRPTKGGAAFGGFRLHRRLLGLAMQGMPLKKWIVFLFLQPIRSSRAFLVPRRHVARRRFAQRFRFGAFQRDYLLRHGSETIRSYSFVFSAGAGSSSPSESPPSSSVKPKRDVTDCRTREALFCFSS